VLSRVVWGTRASLMAGVVSVSIALALGMPLGLVSGYQGGIVDAVVMRMTVCATPLIRVGAKSALSGYQRMLIAWYRPPHDPRAKISAWREIAKRLNEFGSGTPAANKSLYESPS